MYGDLSLNNQADGGLEVDRQLHEAKRELGTWKTNAGRADDIKSRLVLEQLEVDETKERAKQEAFAWVKKQDDVKKEFTQRMSEVQGEITKLVKHKEDMLDKLKRCHAELQSKRAECTRLRQEFKISAQIPDTEVRFIAQDKETEDNSQLIRGVFVISQRPTVLLQGGQALITFTKEKVASQILGFAQCSVACKDMSLDVNPRGITMNPVAKFEVHLGISRKELKVSNIPPLMPEERTKDRLEICFSRPSRGGGEVKAVEYNKNTGTGHVTFLHPGVAQDLALRGTYQVDLDSKVNVKVEPVCEQQLCNFQTFCGSPKCTILLDGIKDILDEEDLQDFLEIHFQEPRNSGGEIESIKYLSVGKTLQAALFEDVIQRQQSPTD